MSPNKGHDPLLTIETIEGRTNPDAPRPPADDPRPSWLKQQEPDPLARIERDLRERIAQAIDQAHTEAKYLLLDDGYREGYLDGLDAAERIARGES
jgi:flagellar biosynthesis/type III secretory pathway protein FliH